MQETQVPSLGREDPLEKEMATHSSILAWRIPWIEEPGGLQSMGSKKQNKTKLCFVSSAFCAVLSCSVVSDSETPWTAACQVPLSMEIFR